MKTLLPALFLLCSFVQCRQQAISPDFQLHEDFNITLVAKEPLVFDPVDLEFDHLGRAFVLEMPGYPWVDEESRIVLLQDLDQDGIYDQRLLFSENLGAATSLLPYQKGFLVAAPPHVLYIADRDGDLQEDYRQIVLSGFEVGNTQHNFNGLTYGIDNWIYAANGGNNGHPFWPGDSSTAVALRGNDLRFKVKTKTLELWGKSSGGFELAMDSWGRIFETHNLTHISHLVIPARYLEGLTLEPGHSLENISDHEESNLARVYPIGPQETRVNHPEQSGYFSGACGITYYGGGAFPEEFNGNIFVADVVLNLVHRDVIETQGASFKALRQDQKKEFLASSDRSFRPVNMTVGPDGALYLLDMHRKVIEHPEWIPDEIENTLDLEAGKDQGRIYRITHKTIAGDNFTPMNPLDPVSLTKHLSHPNQWRRLNAQRLLIEGNHLSAVPAINDLVTTGTNPWSRAHALWTLEGMGQLDEDLLLIALQDSSPEVRVQALLAGEIFAGTYPKLSEAIVVLLKDEHPRVRMQCALTLGRWLQQAALTLSDDLYQACHELVVQSQDQPWVLQAVLSTVRSGPQPLMVSLLQDPQINTNPLILQLMRSLASVEVQTGGDLVKLLAFTADNSRHPAPVDAILEGILQGLDYRKGLEIRSTALAMHLNQLERSLPKSSLAPCWKIRERMGIASTDYQKSILREAFNQVADTALADTIRLASLKLLEFMGPKDKIKRLFTLLNPLEDRVLQEEALIQLTQITDLEVAHRLVELWSSLGPQMKNRAGNALLYQTAYHPTLLDALERKKIALGELNFDLERRRTLLLSEDSQVSYRAKRLFSDAGVVTRREALIKMGNALELPGVPESGALVFQKACASCHQINDLGTEVGPNLTEISRKSLQTLLHDIVDPNAAVDTRYLAYTLKTRQGVIYHGMVISESDEVVIIRQMGGVESTISRKDIQSFQTDGNSYMPEGLEMQLSLQEMADLLAYLQNTVPL